MDSEILAPNSVDSEQAALGSILINPDVLQEVTGFLLAKMFYIVRNGWIYDAMLTIRDRGEAIDNLTVIEEMRNRGKLQEIGGPAYITLLINQCPTWIHGATYARAVRRQWVRRRKLAKAQSIGQIAMDDNLSEDEINDKTDKVYFEDVDIIDGDETVTIQSLASEFFDDVQFRYEHPGHITGVPTGYPTLDDMLGGGPQKGDLVIVAARPGVGKTALALGIGVHASAAGYNTGVFSLEMEPKQLIARAAAGEAKLNSQRFRAGNLNEREWAQFTDAIAVLSKLPMYFDGSKKVNVREMSARCSKMQRQYGLDLIIIDYLQLMVSGDPKYETQEIGAITRRLKLLAQELDIPVICLCQLNRATEQRQDKRPKLSDLRQSGAIEQDADTVIALYRDVMYNPNTPDPESVEAHILKQRNGGIGMVPMKYVDNITRFYDAAEFTKMNGNSYLDKVLSKPYSGGNGHHEDDDA